nr:ribonuclease H-like domain-containing protein [Tanacetum cinerariifolium]
MSANDKFGLSVEPSTSIPKPVVNESKLVNEPKVVGDLKVWTDAPIIKEYESDIHDDSVSNVLEEKETPSFAFTDSFKHVKSPRENVKEIGKPNHYPNIEKQNRHSHTRKGNKAHLVDYQEFKGGSAAFGGSNGRITSKGKIKAGRLDFQDVYYVEELKQYNLFFVSQMYDKKNKVLFTDTDCLVLSPDFKLPDENQILHMGLFGPTSVKSINHKTYCLAITDGFSSVEPSTSIPKPVVNESKLVNEPKVVGDLKVWIDAPNIKEYESDIDDDSVSNVPEEKETPSFAFTDSFKHFDGKSDLGFLVGYSLNSKDFRVYNLETKRVEENLHVNFLENKPNVAGKGHAWMFDLDYLTNSMNYEPVSLENQANKSAGLTEANNNAGDKLEKNEKPVSQVEQVFLEELEKLKRQEKEANDAARKEATHDTQDANTNNTNLLNAASAPVSAVGPSRALNDDEPLYLDDPLMLHLEDIYVSPSEGIFTNSSYDDEGVVTDFNNLEITVNVSLTPTTRIHTIYPKT